MSQVTVVNEKPTPEYVDFPLVKTEDLHYSLPKSSSRAYRTGTIVYDKAPRGNLLVVQSPWLRTTTGWQESEAKEYNGKKINANYHVNCSMSPPDNTSDANKYISPQYQSFIEMIDQRTLEVVKENWEEWVGEEVPSDDILRLYQTSVIQKANDGYPPFYKYSFTDMVTQREYNGTVFEQGYDLKAQKPTNVHRPSKIQKLRKNAHIRFQLVLKSFYFSVSQNEMGDKQIRFGVNWLVQKVVFYNVLDTLVDETTMHAFSFGDIVVNESFAPTVSAVTGAASGGTSLGTQKQTTKRVAGAVKLKALDQGVEVEVVEMGGKRQLTSTQGNADKKAKVL